MCALLAARAYVGSVVTVEHVLLGGGSDEAAIGAQMLSRACCRARGVTAGRGTTRASSVGTNCVMSLRLAAVTMIDSWTPRASTSNIRLLPFFPQSVGLGLTDSCGGRGTDPDDLSYTPSWDVKPDRPRIHHLKQEFTIFRSAPPGNAMTG